MITELHPGQVFVFGSNLAGRHGAGAALAARKWGAKLGKGHGRHGQTYAIPTKDFHLNPLSLVQIRTYVDIFLHYASSLPRETFLLTPIGCGLAGYTPQQISPMFYGAPLNVVMPAEFSSILDKMWLQKNSASLRPKPDSDG